MRFIPAILVCGSVLFTGCSSVVDTQLNPEHISKPLATETKVWRERPSSTYVRVIEQKEWQVEKRVLLSVPDGSLLQVLKMAVPDASIVPVDTGVDLKMRLAVIADNMTLTEYIKMLEGMTGYAIVYENDLLKVSSLKSKKWNLAALASQRKSSTSVSQQLSAGSGGAGSSANMDVKNDEDAWESLIENAEAILGVKGGSGGGAKENQLKPYVTGIRSIGLLSAAGAPARIDVLDQYIKNLEGMSSKQINIDVKVFDVRLDDNRGSGIDWSALIKGTTSGNPFNLYFGQDPTTTGNIANGGISYLTGKPSWEFGGTITDAKRGSLESMVRFLEQYGSVELVNQPNVTTLNGSTAYLSSGDEFSYISSISEEEDDNGDTTVTPEFARIKVGVSLSVTPRVLDGERILLDVIPVVSSIQGSDQYEVGGFSFSTPVIALQELATQVITRNGQPIQLGGLISKKVSESLTTLPFKNKATGEMLSFMFEADENDLERREIVITVVPTILESGKWATSAK